MCYYTALQYHKIFGTCVAVLNNIPLENLIPGDCSTGIKKLMYGLIHESGKVSL